MRFALTIVVASTLLATALSGQVEWRDRSAVANHAMAYHQTAQQLVRFGGGTAVGTLRGDTWVAPPSGIFLQTSPPTAPSARQMHRMAYVDHLDEVLLFGGLGDSGPLADLWGWNGFQWRELQTTGGPAARFQHAMAYDPVRQVLVVHGGQLDTHLQSAETWEFDGINWTDVSATPSPPCNPLGFSGACSDAMAFNPVTQRMAYYTGGANVWEWDGTAWTEITPATTSPWNDLDGAELVTDPAGAGVVLAGGDDLVFGTGVIGGFYLWTGTDWVDWQANATYATARSGHAATTTATDIVIHGGGVREEDTFVRENETYLFDGTTWTFLTPEPIGRYSGQLVFDTARDELVLLDGYRAFFPVGRPAVRRGNQWFPIPSGPPGLGRGHAYDSVRSRIVSFGGTDFTLGGGPTYDQTWEWDGTAWSQALPLTSPVPRNYPAMAFDPAAGVSVLFGGIDALGLPLTDTWTFDGTEWTLASPVTIPAATGPMTYDPAAFAVVMAEGSTLWSFSGGDWSAEPAPVADALSLSYDTRRGRLVLVATGGVYERTESGAWQQRTTIGYEGHATYDPSIGTTILWTEGGLCEYGPTSLGSWLEVGPGCVGPNGTPELIPRRDPYLGDSWTIDVANASGDVFACIGFDDTQWNGMILPALLDGLGLTGCTLYQDIERYDILTPGIPWTLALPSSNQLLGQEVLLQALVSAPGFNPGEAVVTNGLSATLGGG